MKPVYEYGQARLFKADCLSWLKAQAEGSVHAVVTDPPYGVREYEPEDLKKMKSGSGGVWRQPPAFDGHRRAPLPRFTVLTANDRERQIEFFEAFSRALLPVLAPGGHVFLACNPLLAPHISEAMVAGGLESRGQIVRLVMTMRGGDRPKNAHEEFPDVSVMPRSQWEPWLLLRKPLSERTVADNLRKWGTGGLRRISGERPFGDVIRSAPTGVIEKRIAPHPSLKPQAFLRQVVRASLPLGQGVVLDPFAGSGSTLAAAEAVGYASVGVERSTEFAALAKKSIGPLARLTGSEEID